MVTRGVEHFPCWTPSCVVLQNPNIAAGETRIVVNRHCRPRQIGACAEPREEYLSRVAGFSSPNVSFPQPTRQEADMPFDFTQGCPCSGSSMWKRPATSIFIFLTSNLTGKTMVKSALYVHASLAWRPGAVSDRTLWRLLPVQCLSWLRRELRSFPPPEFTPLQIHASGFRKKHPGMPPA